jgi:hypothetical protein
MTMLARCATNVENKAIHVQQLWAVRYIILQNMRFSAEMVGALQNDTVCLRIGLALEVTAPHAMSQTNHELIRLIGIRLTSSKKNEKNY